MSRLSRRTLCNLLLGTSRTLFGLLLVAPACNGSGGASAPAAVVQCSAAAAYDLSNVISDFEGSDSGWFAYADKTPGGVPALPYPDGTNNVPLVELNPPRCGSTGAIRLQASGNNYWGAGFGDWQHLDAAADGTGSEGIAFWARAQGNTDKTFLLKVDEGRTAIKTPAGADAGVDAGPRPGDIVPGTQCQVPPTDTGDPSCYYGGTQPPTAASRVPQPGECGNYFHTYITVTKDWQLYLVPWRQLVQWPCPNRLEGGINVADIRKVEVRFIQGTNYDLWLDDVTFYRRR